MDSFLQGVDETVHRAGGRAPSAPGQLARRFGSGSLMRLPGPADRRQRKFEQEPRTTVARAAGKPPAVIGGDRSRDRESAPSGAASTSRAPAKVGHRGWESGTPIGYLHPDAGPVNARGNLDQAAAVLDRVADQIVDRLGEPEPIAVDGWEDSGQAKLELRPMAFRSGGQCLHAIAQQRCEIHFS